ncbi:VanZ family protein [Microbacterium sp. NPDC064584]|uniref:VanZ family protein n=1 Tax=Microbacterium sp. NPDC064584 TaxID=3155817 RepID=UPI0034294D7E
MRDERRRPLVVHVVYITLLGLYATLIAVIVLSPNRVDGDGMGVYRILYGLYGWGLPRWITYQTVEVSANVIVMVPFGMLMALLLPRRLWWVAVIVCSAVSLSAEVVQALLPGRMPSASDWIANTAGGLAGAGIAVLFRAQKGAKVST